MNKTFITLEEIKLVGITARTANALEMDPATAQIGATRQKFFASDMQSQILARKNPGKIFAVYTEYETDEHGPYTYFLGQEVAEFQNIPQGFKALTIAAQTYVKFTSAPGKMPVVCIDMWQNIWKMSAADLGGKRAYTADFEIYDERSQDPQNTVLDIYIAMKKTSSF